MPDRSASTQREDTTFDLTPFVNKNLDAIAAAMATTLKAGGVNGTLDTLKVERARSTSGIGVLVGSFDTERTAHDIEVQARADGTIAEYFNPGDFAASMRIAQQALAAQRVPLSSNVLTEFTIRGNAPATPSSPGSYVGVSMDYQTGAKRGTIVVEPGKFPQVRENTFSRPATSGFSFSQLSPTLFNSIRSQAMQRGNVRAFDRNAVALEVTSTSAYDVPPPLIRIAMSTSETASGRYSMAGKFLMTGIY